ncbi:MAG: methionine--tRNA ligase subunit beta [Omnitrophica bacterium]|nr:methionine--tRNA ligase subunit beta [Candidatus Omnitrophota bacterium]
MITFDQFKAIDIRIAKIVSAEDHPNADKLYVLTVEVGEGTKKLVAGIKEHYTKEELVNKEVVVINNLQPATIRGVQSEGMALATKDGGKLALLVPEKEVKVGSPVS